MLQPARMTRIVLGGHLSRMEEAIGALHHAGVVHLEDYRDDAGRTAIGTPLEAGDELSALLVRLRGLQKALGAEGLPPRAIATDEPGEILDEADEACRGAIEHLAEVRSQAALQQSELAALKPFLGVELDLSLLEGLESLRSFFGVARHTPRLDVPHEMGTSLHEGGVAVALFVRRQDAQAAEHALQAVGFSPAPLPAGRRGTPRQRLTELRAEHAEVEARLRAAEAQVAALRAAWGPRLAALAGHLVQEVQKTQAPLRFGVTEQTFHAEGWVPRRSAHRLRKALEDRLGPSLYLQELGDRREGPHAPAHVAGQTAAAATGADAAHHDHDDPAREPPVHLENPRVAKPYQFLLGLLGRPRYKEIDPSMLMLVFFPLFFGLMVGDVVVGLLIALLGLWLKKNHIFGIGGPGVGRPLFAGGVLAIIVGAFVFGEALGIHFVVDDHALEEGELSWESILYGREAVLAGEAGFPHEGIVHKAGAAGHADGDAAHAAAGGAEPALEAGAMHTLAEEAEVHGAGGPLAILAPHSETHLSLGGQVNLGYYSKIHDIQALLIWSVLIGVVHLVLGLLIGFRNVTVAHGANLAVQEKLSWLGILFGVVAGVVGLQAGSTPTAAIGFGVAAASVVLLWMGTAKVLGLGFISILEIPSLAGNILSYTRLAAIGASKAGIVIAVIAIADLATGGHMGFGWWLVYILGMVAITLLATLSGGLQSLRLQFVEFFQKFYTGGGRPYVPFGSRAP